MNEIQKLEQLMNDWANENCKRYRIQPNSFKIILKKPDTKELLSRSYGYVVETSEYHSYMHDEDHSVIRPKKMKIVTSARDLLDQSNVKIAEFVNGSVMLVTLYIPLSRKGGDLQSQFREVVRKMQHTVRGLFKYMSDPRLHQDSELFNPTIIGDTVHEYYQVSEHVRAWRKRKYEPNEVGGHKRDEFSILVKREVTFIHKDTGISYTVEDFNNSRTEWDMRQECWEKCAEKVDEYKDIVESTYEEFPELAVPSKAIAPMSLYEDAQLPNKILQDIYLG